MSESGLVPLLSFPLTSVHSEMLSIYKCFLWGQHCVGWNNETHTQLRSDSLLVLMGKVWGREHFWISQKNWSWTSNLTAHYLLVYITHFLHFSCVTLWPATLKPFSPAPATAQCVQDVTEISESSETDDLWTRVLSCQHFELPAAWKPSQTMWKQELSIKSSHFLLSSCSPILLSVPICDRLEILRL